MTLQRALRDALRDLVGPAARERGFAGSAPTWRKRSAIDDWAIVNVESSSWNSSERLRCVINVAVAPEPWLAWMRTWPGVAAFKTVGENFGLYRERVYPSDGSGWWEIQHRDDAVDVAADMIVRLDQNGWPTLNRLLDRDQMLEQLRDGNLGMMRRDGYAAWFERAEALLLADTGRVGELDKTLETLRLRGGSFQGATAAEFESWVRARRR